MSLIFASFRRTIIVAPSLDLYASQLIRISFVIPTLDQSGAERQLTLLATALANSGHEVHVVALNRGGHFESELRDAGISVTVLHKRFRFDLLTFVRLRAVLRKQQPDIVHSFLFAANAYVRLPGVCPAGAKIVVAERCVDSWKSGWQHWLDRQQINQMHAMTANSASVAEFYQNGAGVPSERIHVIPNGIPAAPDGVVEADLRAELGLSAQTPIVGFVGRLALQKRLRDLIWAFHLLHQVVEGVALVLIGDGPERDDLGQYATSVGCRESVYFAGHRADPSGLIPQLDAFCLCSEFEGMSNSLMEAMAAAVPCVVSDIAPNQELITHETDGLVFRLGDSVEMCSALKRVLVDRDFAATLGQSAQQKMQTSFRVDRMVQTHLDLYENLSRTSVDNSRTV